MAARRPIDLSPGGASWAGWRLAPYGRARDWRLQAPNGEIFEALELLELRALRLDVDWLRLRVRQLEARAGARACYLTDAERVLLREAAALLARVLPAAPRRRRRALNYCDSGTTIGCDNRRSRAVTAGNDRSKNCTPLKLQNIACPQV